MPQSAVLVTGLGRLGDCSRDLEASGALKLLPRFLLFQKMGRLMEITGRWTISSAR